MTTGAIMDPLTRLQSGIDQAASVIDQITPQDYQSRTPCTEWNVRELMNHMVGALVMFRDVGVEGSVDPAVFAADHLGDAPATALRTVGAAAVGAWAAPGRIEGMATLPFGEFPAAFALGLPAMDMLVHSWDLATATGQDVEWDRELVSDVAAFSQATFSDPAMRGDDFGPPVDPGPDADELSRLVAFLGRPV